MQQLRHDEVIRFEESHPTREHRQEQTSAEPFYDVLSLYPSEEGYYYDTHPLLEDTMSEGSPHYWLLHYLVEVLRWLYEGQVCVVHGNLGIHQSRERQQPALAPDLCVFKGMGYEPIPSWKIGQTGPPPQVVFEIASKGTWERDVEDKPALYARMGVEEYFLYDPAIPPVMEGGRRLLGWTLYPSGLFSPLACERNDWLWSQQLESYLGADEQWLRLYDPYGQLRLTGREAFEQNLQLVEQDLQLAEEENQALVQEMLLVEQDLQLVEQENRLLAQKNRTLAQQKQLAEQEKQLAEQRAHALEQEKRLLAEKLRALGINLDDLA